MLPPILEVPDTFNSATPVIAAPVEIFPLRSKSLPPPTIPPVKVAREASIRFSVPALANVTAPVYV